MKAEAINAFMALPQDRKTWDKQAWRTLRNHEVFVCVDFGQEPETTVDNWNRVVEPIWAVTATTEHASTPAGYTTKLVCNGRSSQVLYEGSRHDCILDVLALNSVAKADIELRICKDSIGNSDLCFLPLTPNEWRDLETTYGEEFVSRRFARLPATLDAFLKQLA